MTSPSNIAAASILAMALGTSACSTERADAKRRITPEYDKAGKLQLLKYDSKDSGRVDTWSYMDGARVVRIEIDRDGDGHVDRWEHYGPDQKLEKVGTSSSNDGKVDRVEFYQRDAIVRADEDTNRDGRTDKWETYAGAQLASVAFDTSHRGVPDRRLTYGPGGAATVEVDLKGDGHLLPAGHDPTSLVTSSTQLFKGKP
jgi:hypothetical protein